MALVCNHKPDKQQDKHYLKNYIFSHVTQDIQQKTLHMSRKHIQLCLNLQFTHNK